MDQWVPVINLPERWRHMDAVELSGKIALKFQNTLVVCSGSKISRPDTRITVTDVKWVGWATCWVKEKDFWLDCWEKQTRKEKLCWRSHRKSSKEVRSLQEYSEHSVAVPFRTHQVRFVGVVKEQLLVSFLKRLSLLRAKRVINSLNYSILFQHADFLSFYSKEY